jgi:hypothetical protein
MNALDELLGLITGMNAGLDGGWASLRGLLFAVQQWLSAPPDLPKLASMDAWRRVAWALVVALMAWRGALGLWRLPHRPRAVLAVLLASLACAPGPWGLSHWLGLAFQAPSLATVGVVLLWWRFGRTQSRRFFDVRIPTRAGSHWADAGLSPLCLLSLLGLGWALMLDTFAMWPVFIYPLGYGNGALVGAVLISLGLMGFQAGRALGAVTLLACLVFAVTRLPSGNLWDALSDPWLWLIAHGILIRQILQKVSFG